MSMWIFPTDSFCPPADDEDGEDEVTKPNKSKKKIKDSRRI